MSGIRRNVRNFNLPKDVLDIIDTAGKIGLGALISGRLLFGYMVKS